MFGSAPSRRLLLFSLRLSHPLGRLRLHQRMRANTNTRPGKLLTPKARTDADLHRFARSETWRQREHDRSNASADEKPLTKRIGAYLLAAQGFDHRKAVSAAGRAFDDQRAASVPWLPLGPSARLSQPSPDNQLSQVHLEQGVEAYAGPCWVETLIAGSLTEEHSRRRRRTRIAAVSKTT